MSSNSLNNSFWLEVFRRSILQKLEKNGPFEKERDTKEARFNSCVITWK